MARSNEGFEQSWYYATANPHAQHPPLTQSLVSDVCIVGAGYTGLSAAIELAERGLRVVVLEAHRVGSGASGRNGGVLGMGQRKDQWELERWLGKDQAHTLWQIAVDANALVRERVQRYGIRCDLADGELHAAHRPRHVDYYQRYAEHLQRVYNYDDLSVLDAAEISAMLGTDVYYGGYLDRRAGHLHPLNLALGLADAAVAAGAQIFECSAVTDLTEGQPVVLKTAEGEVRADYVLLACNGYLDGLAKRIENYQMPINNFVVATEPLGREGAWRINRDNVAVVDSRFVVNYFHNTPDGRLVFGGGENYSSKFPQHIDEFVRPHMTAVYPQLKDVKIEYAWGGTLAITMRRMPQFGRRGANLYWAQGYSGHGIAMANMGGKLAALAITGSASGFDAMARLKHLPFPGGRWLRWPALVLGMSYYAMLDRF